MCPRPVRVLDVTVEPHVGGLVRIDVDDEGTRVLISGQFLTIDRPNLLRFTWSNSNWPDPTVESVVNVAFESVGDDETLMSIEHSLLPAIGIRELRRRLDQDVSTSLLPYSDAE